MSLLIQTSPKHCANRGFHLKKKFVCCVSTSISTILSVILLAYLILHPSKPQFSLKEAAISGPNSTVQVTLLSRNPNTRVGVFYENVRAYAASKGRRISEDSQLPSFYQGCGESSVLVTSLRGTAKMPAPASGGLYEVGRGRMAGAFATSVKIDGELRWKVGSWTSGAYRLGVDCVAIIGLRTGAEQGTRCSTKVLL